MPRGARHQNGLVGLSVSSHSLGKLVCLQRGQASSLAVPQGPLPPPRRPPAEMAAKGRGGTVAAQVWGHILPGFSGCVCSRHCPTLSVPTAAAGCWGPAVLDAEDQAEARSVVCSSQCLFPGLGTAGSEQTLLHSQHRGPPAGCRL